MMVRVLTGKDLARISRSNIVEYVLEGVSEPEKDISLNELKDNFDLISTHSERKIKLANLIKLLHILVNEAEHDPLTGKILIEAEHLLTLLIKMKGELDAPSGVNLGRMRTDSMNYRLNHIIAYLEAWRRNILKKVLIKPGNKHLSRCYHPDFAETYKFLPSYLPPDYRSNFFFEIYVKELCPFTTMLGFHPFSDAQSNFQDAQSLELLTRVHLDVELRDNHAIEKSDNIRALRVHGPRDKKSLPGSYIVVKGGHHRMRALFKKYLKGEVDGNLKILVQLVTLKDFPISPSEHLAAIQLEIRKRHKIRRMA